MQQLIIKGIQQFLMNKYLSTVQMHPQYLDHSEGIEHNNNSKTNDSNKDDTRENIDEEIELNNNGYNDSYIDYLSENSSEDMQYNNDSETNDSNEEGLS